MNVCVWGGEGGEATEMNDGKIGIEPILSVHVYLSALHFVMQCCAWIICWYRPAIWEQLSCLKPVSKDLATRVVVLAYT